MKQLCIPFDTEKVQTEQCKQLDLIEEHNKKLVQELTKDIPVRVEHSSFSRVHSPLYHVLLKDTNTVISTYNIDTNELLSILEVITQLYKNELIDFNKTVSIRNIIKYMHFNLINHYRPNNKWINAMLNRPSQYIRGQVEHTKHKVSNAYTLKTMLNNKKTHQQALDIIDVLALVSHRHLLNRIEHLTR